MRAALRFALFALAAAVLVAAASAVLADGLASEVGAQTPDKQAEDKDGGGPNPGEGDGSDGGEQGDGDGSNPGEGDGKDGGGSDPGEGDGKDSGGSDPGGDGDGDNRDPGNNPDDSPSPGEDGGDKGTEDGKQPGDGGAPPPNNPDDSGDEGGQEDGEAKRPGNDPEELEDPKNPGGNEEKAGGGTPDGGDAPSPGDGAGTPPPGDGKDAAEPSAPDAGGEDGDGGGAGAPGVRTATFYGGGLDVGDVVTASIGGAECGEATVGDDGGWSIAVAEGGCGGRAAPGAVVAFAIDGRAAAQTATWQAGGLPDDVAGGIALTLAVPPPPSLTLDLDGARGVYVQDADRRFAVYVVGAPDFVNAQFVRRWVSASGADATPPTLTLDLEEARAVYVREPDGAVAVYVVGAPDFVNAPFVRRWIASPPGGSGAPEPPASG